MAEALVVERKRLTSVIAREVASILPDSSPEATASLASSLIATVHGHCAFLLGGTFALMGIQMAQELAAARVTIKVAGVLAG